MMTRDEFEAIETWGELISVARDYEYDDLDDVVDDDYVSERIKERTQEIGYGDDWIKFAEWVSDIPRNCDYYEVNYTYDEFNGLYEDDFDKRKNDLFIRLLDDGEIEEDEENNENYDEWERGWELELSDPDSEDDNIQINLEEPFSLAALIGVAI